MQEEYGQVWHRISKTMDLMKHLMQGWNNTCKHGGRMKRYVVMKLFQFFSCITFGMNEIEPFKKIYGYLLTLPSLWILNKIQEHKLILVPVKRRTIIEPVINREIHWDCFDGASQSEPPLGGAGEILHLSTEIKLCIKYSLGQATNNKADIAALWAVLKMKKSRQIQNIQIYGDTKNCYRLGNWKKKSEHHIYIIY